MRDSLLLKYLEKLPAAERDEFHRWLASPFFNRRKAVQALFEYIAEHLTKHPENLRKEEVFAAIFPGEPYDNRKLNYHMSWLLEQLRDYLGWREWQRDEAEVQLYRCRALRRYGMQASFEKEIGQARATLATQSWRDEHWHYLNYQISREKYEYTALQSRTVRAASGLSLDEMTRHATLAHRLNQLRLYCSAEALNTVAGERSGTMSVTAPVEPSVELYENLLQALRFPAEETAFFRARQLLEENWAQFRDSERRDLYLLALNFCIRKINGGQRQFMRAAFDLYRSGLENKALFENGALSRFTYKNAVTAGLALFEFDWVRTFIEDYKIYLPPRERHHAYVYNLAMYYFRLPDYDQAMCLLRDADFGDDTLSQLDARTMLLRIYFERGFQDALESLLDSFQTYLRRQKDLGYHRDNYLNLLRFTRRMLRLAPGETPERAHLLKTIAETPALAERDWLLEKCGKG